MRCESLGVNGVTISQAITKPIDHGRECVHKQRDADTEGHTRLHFVDTEWCIESD